MAKPHKTKTNAADCRKCRWRDAVVDGVSVGCKVSGLAIPWEVVPASGPGCPDFVRRRRRKRKKANGGSKR